MLTAALVFVTASMPLPIRECDTDSDCVAAAAEIGCREYHNAKRPNVLFVCNRKQYRAAIR